MATKLSTTRLHFLPKARQAVWLFWLFVFVSQGVAAKKSTTSTGYRSVKISYVHSASSPSLLYVTKQQVPDKQKFAKVKKMLEDSKIYYSLYINRQTKESILVCDSVRVHPSVLMVGPVEFAYQSQQHVFSIVERFLGKEWHYIMSQKDMQWQRIDTISERRMLGYQIVAGRIHNDPDKYAVVWIAPDFIRNSEDIIYRSGGPSYYYGLPGIVVYVENIFGKFQAVEVKKLPNTQVMDSLMGEIAENNRKHPRTSIPWQTILTKRRIYTQKFMRMLDAKAQPIEVTLPGTDD